MTNFIEKVSAAVSQQNSLECMAESDDALALHLDLVDARNYAAQVFRNLVKKLTYEFDRTLKAIEYGEPLPSNIVVNPFSDSEFFTKEVKSLKKYIKLGFSAGNPNCGLSFNLKAEFKKEFENRIKKEASDVESGNMLVDQIILFSLAVSLGSIFYAAGFESDTDVFLINSSFAVNPDKPEKPFIAKSLEAFFKPSPVLIDEIQKLIEVLRNAGVSSKRLSILSSGKLAICLG